MAFRVGAHLASQRCDDAVRRKSDKGIVGAGDYDPSVSPNGLPAPFTQREPNVPAHALSIHSKSPSFYTLISVIILTILTIIAISIKLSFSNAAQETQVQPPSIVLASSKQVQARV